MSNPTRLLVKNKVALYRKADWPMIEKLASRHGMYYDTMSTKAAMVILDDALKANNGRCACCDTVMLTERYESFDPRQFSFDRLDDDLPHIESNVRVICLGCNLRKAKDMYAPDPDWLPTYKLLRDEYFATRLLPADQRILGRNLFSLSNSCNYYHDLTYSTRKKNNWRYFTGYPILEPIPAGFSDG